MIHFLLSHQNYTGYMPINVHVIIYFNTTKKEQFSLEFFIPAFVVRIESVLQMVETAGVNSRTTHWNWIKKSFAIRVELKAVKKKIKPTIIFMILWNFFFFSKSIQKLFRYSASLSPIDAIYVDSVANPITTATKTLILCVFFFRFVFLDPVERSRTYSLIKLISIDFEKMLKTKLRNYMDDEVYICIFKHSGFFFFLQIPGLMFSLPINPIIIRIWW